MVGFNYNLAVGLDSAVAMWCGKGLFKMVAVFSLAQPSPFHLFICRPKHNRAHCPAAVEAVCTLAGRPIGDCPGRLAAAGRAVDLTASRARTLPGLDNRRCAI